MIDDVLMSALRLAVPLIFAAYGGMLSERAGVANIALEANLLFAAFAGAAGAALTGSLWMGAAIGVGASVVVGTLFGSVCVWGRGDQIVIGMGFNLLAFGLIPVINKAIFGMTGSTPSLPLELKFSQTWVFFALVILAVVGYEYLFRYTRHGLRINAAGENPAALVTQGVDYKWVRLRAVVEGSVLTGIGGIYLSMSQGSGYIRDMAAGRGFIALAALIFGAWKPVPTLLACLFFGFTDAIQMLLQGQKLGGVTVPNQFVQILPYVATLFVLVFYSRRMAAPAAINQEPKY